jgi:hypothetical protein
MPALSQKQAYFRQSASGISSPDTDEFSRMSRIAKTFDTRKNGMQPQILLNIARAGTSTIPLPHCVPCRQFHQAWRSSQQVVCTLTARTVCRA